MYELPIDPPDEYIRMTDEDRAELNKWFDDQAVMYLLQLNETKTNKY